MSHKPKSGDRTGHVGPTRFCCTGGGGPLLDRGVSGVGVCRRNSPGASSSSLSFVVPASSTTGT